MVNNVFFHTNVIIIMLTCILFMYFILQSLTTTLTEIFAFFFFFFKTMRAKWKLIFMVINFVTNVVWTQNTPININDLRN